MGVRIVKLSHDFRTSSCKGRLGLTSLPSIFLAASAVAETIRSSVGEE